MKIYVGNLAKETAEPEIRQHFEKFGEVASVVVATDKVNGTSKGYGFVDMPTLDQANAAILGLNGKDLAGKMLLVNEARSGTAKTRTSTAPQTADKPTGNRPDSKK